MNLADALAQAAANGWSDDSAWVPSSVAHQMSTEQQGFLASITVQTCGKIKWNVLSLAGKARSQRGTAPSVDAAMAACESAIASTAETLF